MNLDKQHNFSEKGGRYCEVKEIQNAMFAKLLDEKMEILLRSHQPLR